LKTIRKISPLISFWLAVLLFAGNSGYTFIFHNCDVCTTQEVRLSIDKAQRGCHLSEPTAADNTAQDFPGAVMRHHCRHEIDVLETSELLKTSLQVEVIPFTVASQLICLVPDVQERKPASARTMNAMTARHNLTTLHCQLLS